MSALQGAITARRMPSVWTPLVALLAGALAGLQDQVLNATVRAPG